MNASHCTQASLVTSKTCVLNTKTAVPTCKTVKKSLHLKKIEAEKTIKDRKLKAAIQDMFYHEFLYCRQCTKTTTLEKYELTEADFSCLEYVVHVLLPFKVVQEALQGDKYVTLNFLPLLVHQIKEAIIRFQGAIREGTQPQLKLLVDKMEEDFMVRWGEHDSYTICFPECRLRRIIAALCIAHWT